MGPNATLGVGMWRRCLVAACMAVAGSLATAVPSTGAARAEAADYLNPALVQVGQVPGQIVDVSHTQILYLDSSASPVTLKVLDRASGQTATVPAVPGLSTKTGWLFPGGVVFWAMGADVTTAALFEWEGGPGVTDLGPLNSTYSVVVRPPYVIWADEPALYRRDLATGQTVVVATDAGNWFNDLVPTGEVVYWNNGYQVMRYENGQTEQVSPDTPGRWNVYPITDGINVVYKRQTPCCGNQTYSTVLNHAGSETGLTPPSSFDPAAGLDYDVAGGWTAFQQPDSTGNLHTWLRDPRGTTSQLPDITPAGRPEIDAMNGAGQVLYSSGPDLYLGQTGQPAVLLASTGTGRWGNPRFLYGGNVTTYLGHRWIISIGGTLYAIAPTTSPPVTGLRPGSQLSAGIPPAIPLTTSWTATDPDDPVQTQELQVSVNGGGYAPVSLPSADASQATSAVVPTAQYEFRARATDSHGNVGSWTSGRPFTVDTAQETAATFTGAWTEHHSPTAWGGTTISTTSATAAATISADGQQFAIVGPIGPRNGSMQICVDGAACQAISTFSGRWRPRVILADISLTPGTHTISITRAPKSAGKIELDGFIVLR